MFNKIKEQILRENQMYLHEKKVEVTKLTPVKWKQLFSTVDNLPGLIVAVITSQQSDDYYAIILNAVDLALDEIITVVSIMSEVDQEYIKNHVGLYEIVEYLTKTVEVNRLDTVVKNVKSLLPQI